MRLKSLALLLFLSGSLMCLSCSRKTENRPPSQPAPISKLLIRADVSLQLVVQDLLNAFKLEKMDSIQVTFTSAAQLCTVTPDSVDLYVIPNDHFVLIAKEQNLADPSSAIILGYAIPCLVTPQFNPGLVLNLADIASSNLRVGSADPKTDLLGAFSIEILRRNNLYAAVFPRLRWYPSALALAEAVAQRECDVCIGWTMFPLWQPESVETVLIVPSEIPRVAVICAVRGAHPQNLNDANRLLDFMKSDRCATIFRKWGYSINDSEVNAYAPSAVLGGEPGR